MSSSTAKRKPSTDWIWEPHLHGQKRQAQGHVHSRRRSPTSFRCERFRAPTYIFRNVRADRSRRQTSGKLPQLSTRRAILGGYVGWWSWTNIMKYTVMTSRVSTYRAHVRLKPCANPHGRFCLLLVTPWDFLFENWLIARRSAAHCLGRTGARGSRWRSVTTRIIRSRRPRCGPGARTPTLGFIRKGGCS
jgi:hypothetical protein